MYGIEPTVTLARMDCPCGDFDFELNNDAYEIRYQRYCPECDAVTDRKLGAVLKKIPLQKAHVLLGTNNSQEETSS